MMFEDIPTLVRWLQWNSIVLATVMLVAGRFIPGRGSSAALEGLAMPKRCLRAIGSDSEPKKKQVIQFPRMQVAQTQQQ